MPGEKSRHKQTDDKPEHDEQSVEFKRFEKLTKKLLGVPKDELDEKRQEREKRKRAG